MHSTNYLLLVLTSDVVLLLPLIFTQSEIFLYFCMAIYDYSAENIQLRRLTLQSYKEKPCIITHGHVLYYRTYLLVFFYLNSRVYTHKVSEAGQNFVTIV